MKRMEEEEEEEEEEGELKMFNQAIFDAEVFEWNAFEMLIVMMQSWERDLRIVGIDHTRRL